MIGSRRAEKLGFALFLGFLAALVAASTPRRVGDGSEYWAMTALLLRHHLPSASPADLEELQREAPSAGDGFAEGPIRFANLVSADGRQAFPHFWFYPLINVPALALTSATGVRAVWAFTITNIVLLLAAFAVLARQHGTAWSVMLLAGPIVWWADKAHADVFTFSLITIASASWSTSAGAALLTLAPAATQNPVLAPVWVLVAGVAMWDAAGDATRIRRLAVPGIAGALMVALPLAYYKWRLGVWTPLLGYTAPGAPSLRTVLSLVLDPNIGLVPNAPFVVLACLVGALVSAVRRTDPHRANRRNALLVCAVVGLLLAGFSQSANLNHGATPGVNRWVLWLLPWCLMLQQRTAIGATPHGQRAQRAVRALAGLGVLWTIAFFRPALPEVYRYPTASAAWIWTHVPGWYSPAPEIFAERASHREPAFLPVAWPGCGKMLLVEGEWPRGCAPLAPAPPSCLGHSHLCYASPADDGTSASFVPLGVAKFPWTRAR